MKNLPKVPDVIITIEVCNQEERGQCEIYRREVANLRKASPVPISVGSATVRRIRADYNVSVLCQLPSKIPLSCPKYNEAMEKFDQTLYITVRDGMYGIDYDHAKEDFMRSLGDIPIEQKIEEWATFSTTLFASDELDIEEIRKELDDMGLSEEAIISSIEIRKEEHEDHRRLHFRYKLGLRCPNCYNGKIDTDGLCTKCGQDYYTTLKRQQEILQKDE